MIDHHTALIYTMVLVSASDREMTDSELKTMGDIVTRLPVFRDYDQDKLTGAANECAKLLSDENGLDKAIAMIREALPDRLRGTYRPQASLVTDGSLTMSTRRGAGKRVAHGEPVITRALAPAKASVRPVARLRLRRRCPRPQESWL